MASKDTIDVIWTSHKDSKKIGELESLPTGEAQAALTTGLARLADESDKRSAAAKKAAATRKEPAARSTPATATTDDKPAKK